MFLIRHADAGRRERWDGDDRLRPLSKKGYRQTRGLTVELARARLERVLSSPYVRCVQTVEPLAQARELIVEEREELVEGTAFETTLQLFRELSGTPAALCTHGDVMYNTCEHLIQRGLIRRDEVRYEKGSAWILQEGTDDIVAARYLPAREA